MLQYPMTLLAASLLMAAAANAEESTVPPAATTTVSTIAGAAPAATLDSCRTTYPTRSSGRTAGPLPRYAASQSALSHDEARFVICALQIAQKDCHREGQKCPALDAVLEQLYPGTYDRRFANLVIYVPKEKHAAETPQPAPPSSLPVPFLFSNGKLSPFLFGCQQISVLVLSETESTVLDAHATVVKAKLSNPLQAVLTLLSLKPDTSEEKLTRQPAARLSLSPVGYDPAGGPMLWTSQKTFYLETDTVARITILVRSAQVTPKTTWTQSTETKALSDKQSGAAGSSQPVTINVAATGPVGISAPPPIVPPPPPPAAKAESSTDTKTGESAAVEAVEPTGTLAPFRPCMLREGKPCPPDPTASAGTNLRQMTALVSVPASVPFGFSVASTVTFQREEFRSDTGASLGRTMSFGVVVLGKLYAFKPRLAISPTDARPFSWLPYWPNARYRPSIGLVLGTNVTGTAFNDWIIGVSVGHILDRAGLLIAASRIGFPAAPSASAGKTTKVSTTDTVVTTTQDTTTTKATTTTTTDTSTTTSEPSWMPKRQWRFTLGIEYTF